MPSKPMMNGYDSVVSRLVQALLFSVGFAIALVPCSFALGGQDDQPASLTKQLLSEDRAALIEEIESLGDPVRGALVFYRADVTCTKCHGLESKPDRIGPVLAEESSKATLAELVESVLDPNKVIKEGYATENLITIDGRVIVGRVISADDEQLTIQTSENPDAPIQIASDDIDERSKANVSLMPDGLANALANRQQFLDLMSYINAVSKGGMSRAKELEPAAFLLATMRIPEYENRVDHRGLIEDWNDESFKRGEKIYNQLCINCHGTVDSPGSLPTSLRFASGKFKNGSDPHSMYRTLTYGFGLMAAQGWMVPQQKYDVIHYIREAYLRPHNPSQLTSIDADLLAALPTGNTRGPEPREYKPWAAMNYGPTMAGTFEFGNDGHNFAYKGIAVRLDPGPGGVAQGHQWIVYDHDTMRVAGAWRGDQFIDWNGIQFNGRHNIHPRIQGEVQFENHASPGWMNPNSKTWDDPRITGRDGKHYGPLPKEWTSFEGLYHYEQFALIQYRVGNTKVLEMPGVEYRDDLDIVTRAFEIGPRETPLTLAVAQGESAWKLASAAQSDRRPEKVAQIFFGELDAEDSKANDAAGIWVGISNQLTDSNWSLSDTNQLCLTIPAGDEPIKFTLGIAKSESPVSDKPNLISQSEEAKQFVAADSWDQQVNLRPFLKGGPRRWTEQLQEPVLADQRKSTSFAVDVLQHPNANPWQALVRLTGLDFYDDGDRMAVCSWDGDVWLVSGLSKLHEEEGLAPDTSLTWTRIASGLFQPLGLKIVDGEIYLTCRDQLVILRDLNKDGETDFYECFNNDHQVTEHFHEFAMGLQRDEEGNFYYAKSARHALKALVPHHGTLLKVSADGSKTEILANGFRAANGVCLNPDGSFIVTDQEGHWNPKNRINYVEPGGFYGNMFGYHDVTDSSDAAMEQPLCWITNAFDRSPAELLWVDSPQWGPLNGSLLNLSYGYGKVFVVPHEKVNGQAQGGMCELPFGSLPTGLIRGRFSPDDGQLYTCGMFAWAGSQTQPGGMYRIRYTGKPVQLPIELHAKQGGMEIGFSGKLHPETAINPKHYQVKVWSLKRTANYGSDHYNEHQLDVTEVELSEDRQTVFLKIPDIEPTWCMEIKYQLKSESGESFEGKIHNTIHELVERE